MDGTKQSESQQSESRFGVGIREESGTADAKTHISCTSVPEGKTVTHLERDVAVIHEETETIKDGVLEGILPTLREVTETFSPQMLERETAFSMTLSHGVPISDPVELKLAERINADHISQKLKSANQKTVFEYEDRREARWLCACLAIAGLVFFGFLVVQFKDSNPEFIKDLILAAGTFLGGLGAGMWSANRSKRE